MTLLDLTDNDISTLPPELGRMTTLRVLPLSGNPIRGLRTNQPLSALLTSLRNRLEEVTASCPSSLLLTHHVYFSGGNQQNNSQNKSAVGRSAGIQDHGSPQYKPPHSQSIQAL